jgi:threonine aldolase
MLKYRFFNDYSEGAHPSILEWLSKTNLDQEDGYGVDSICRQAETLLKQQIEDPGAAIHFISGGTQANRIALSALLKPYESVIAADSAHIQVHEAGAIESSGHKINLIRSKDGKLTAGAIQEVVNQHTDEHMVKPRVVFISNSTEVGTVYTRGELESISQVCRANGLYLYLDGARLGSALTSPVCDIRLPELARLLDVFYIGGTKNGALLGEALVIMNRSLQPDFRFYLKQNGALLAKGRILGVQFLGLFQDGLYFELARSANRMAAKLAQGIEEQGFAFLTPPASNQIFPVLPDVLIEELHKLYGFYVWCRVDETHSAIRLVASWATQEARVAEFLQDMRALYGPLARR